MQSHLKNDLLYLLRILESVETAYNLQELKEFLVAKMYEKGLISSGTGSKMLDIRRREFILMLAKYDVDYINYSVEELQREIENLKQ